MINIINDDILLINDILDRNYYSYFKEGKKGIKIIFNDIIKEPPEKIQKLYLNQNTYKKTKTEKNQNLNMLIDWYINNNFLCDLYFYNIDFSQESILILKTAIEKFNNSYVFPKNIYFYCSLKDIEQIKKIQEDIKVKYINFIYCFEINGKYCDFNLYSDQDYKILQNLMQTEKCKIFSEINSTNIKYWIQNFKWWIINFGPDIIYNIQLNEKLDETWDEQSIMFYFSFLDFQIDYFHDFFTESIFKEKCFKDKIPFSTFQILDKEILTNKKYYKDCDFHNLLTIHLNSLNILPCYNLDYIDFHIGNFIIENNKITQVMPKNISMLITTCHLKRSSTPHCEYCNLLNICDGPCYANNYLNSYNVLCPIRESCNLIQNKIKFILYKFKKMNININSLNNLNETFKKDLFLINKNLEELTNDQQ